MFELLRGGLQSMEIAKLLWNVKEAGSSLGISPWTIRRYIAKGKLAAVRIGRRVLLEPAECRRLVDDERRTVPPR
jgi:excisionase family DNA binding protein